MAVTFTYDSGYKGHKVTIIGYSALTPCTFQNIYDADKLTSLSLHARTNITVIDGANVAVDKSLMPADYLVLGGTDNDLYITVANWNGTTASIFITGTDKSGTAQTETIVVTANGTYYTTKWYKTVTYTRVTAFTGTIFDYDLIQRQFGVMWKMGSKEFGINNATFYLGDATNDGYLGDEDKTLIIMKHPEEQYVFDAHSGKGHMTFGNYLSVPEKTTQNGVVFILDWWPWAPMGAHWGRNHAEVYLYGCEFRGDSGCTCGFNFADTDGRIWDTRFTEGSMLQRITGDMDVNNLTITKSYSPIYFAGGNATFNKIDCWDAQIGLSFTSLIGDATAKGVISRGITYKSIQVFTGNGYDCHVIDAELDWTKGIKFYNATGSNLYRQYTFNLKVTDKDGDAIGDVNVKIWDLAGGNPVIDVDTYAVGHVNEGEIPEQTLNYGYYNDVGGDTPYMKTPHTLQTSKAGYETYKKKFTIDKKTDWNIKLDIPKNFCDAVIG